MRALPAVSISTDAAGPSSQEVYQNELGEVSRICEIGLSISHCRHLLHEFHQVEIAREHESIDHYAGFAAGLNFFEGGIHYKGIAAHRVFVDAASRTGILAGTLTTTMLS